MRKNRTPKRPSRLPAIVPRFLKSAVTVGAIPALVGCGSTHPRMQPVVAQMVNDPAPVVAAYHPDMPADAQPSDAAPTPVQAPVVAAVVPPPPPPPVVAAMAPPPVVAAMVPHPPKPAPKKKPTKVVKPPPPVVAALVAPPAADALVPDAAGPKSKTKRP